VQSGFHDFYPRRSTKRTMKGKALLSGLPDGKLFARLARPSRGPGRVANRLARVRYGRARPRGSARTGLGCPCVAESFPSIRIDGGASRPMPCMARTRKSAENHRRARPRRALKRQVQEAGGERGRLALITPKYKKLKTSLNTIPRAWARVARLPCIGGKRIDRLHEFRCVTSDLGRFSASVKIIMKMVLTSCVGVGRMVPDRGREPNTGGERRG
jgi:hypothetical protein